MAIGEIDNGTDTGNGTFTSLAELGIMIKTLNKNIENAIGKITVVSYSKGCGKNVENEDVNNAVQKMTDVLCNIRVLIVCMQKFKEGMCLYFTTLHPLSGLPMTVDGLVRVGYEVKTKTSSNQTNGKGSRGGKGRGGRGGFEFEFEREEENTWESSQQKEQKDQYSLIECLTKMASKLKNVEPSLEKAKKDHEKTILDSISAKQDGRTKNGTALKPNELEDIAKAVRAGDTKTWSIADGLDRAQTRIEKLLAQITEMQSSTRKSANSSIKLNVPEEKNMHWSKHNHDLSYW
jgi:hypothetical protein